MNHVPLGKHPQLLLLHSFDFGGVLDLLDDLVLSLVLDSLPLVFLVQLDRVLKDIGNPCLVCSVDVFKIGNRIEVILCYVKSSFVSGPVSF